MRTYVVLIALSAVCVCHLTLQQEASSYNEFAVDLLAEMSCMLGSRHNMVLCPISVWSMLALLSEGASGDTYKQLAAALHCPLQHICVRDTYRLLARTLTSNSTAFVVSSANVMVTDTNRPLKRHFQDIGRKMYNMDVLAIDLRQASQSAHAINVWVQRATRNRTQQLVTADDLEDAHLILANSVYVKGAWKFPFNTSDTSDEEFTDEDGEVIGKVPMMKQLGLLMHSFVPHIEAQVVILPYKGDHMSMAVFLPKKKVPVAQVLERLRLSSFAAVHEEVKSKWHKNDDTLVMLPRWKFASDFTLNAALANLDVVDVFTSSANLNGLSDEGIQVSRLIHQANIVVNEEGTEASATTGIIVGNKMMPATFIANRPFAYFIFDNERLAVVFAGVVANPLGH